MKDEDLQIQWHGFLAIIRQSAAQDRLDEILTFFMTPQEKEQFAERAVISRSLLEGKTQRAIAESLSAGIATVSRGAAAVRKLEEKDRAIILGKTKKKR